MPNLGLVCITSTDAVRYRSGIRLVMHPDQFVVRNSERSEVIANSVAILEHNARVLDPLGLPRSTWAA